MVTTTSVCGIDKGILLEAGTNELEILVFRVGGELYGVNVAKVREVLEFEHVTSLPESHPSVEGMLRVRQEVVLLINLRHYLYGDELANDPKSPGVILLLEFNQQSLAFRVDEVQRIFRVSCNQSCPRPEIGGMMAPVTSIVLLGDKMIQMLDFESVSAHIGLIPRPLEEVAAGGATSSAVTCPIVFAEDSMMISAMIKDELSAAGFTNLRGFADGAAAWNYLKALGDDPGENVLDKVRLLITDVEMPRMDGLTLARRVKEHPVLQSVPVVLFSSLVSRDNEKKGNQVGASAQVTKPRYVELASTIRTLIEQPVA